MGRKQGVAVMSKWVANRMLALRAWSRATGDRGQTSFEYLGIAVVIAVIIGVLAGTTDIGTAVLNGILDKIQDIIDAG
jgi:nucleoside permease NupC